MSIDVGTESADIADITVTGLQIGLVAVEGFPNRLRLNRAIRGMLDLLLPVARLFLGLCVAEDMDAVGVERIIGRAERCFLAEGRRNQLGEPDAALRRLSVAKGETRRERRPIGRLA